MKYNANTNEMEVTMDQLKRISADIRFALIQVRKIAGLPMDKYSNKDEPLAPADHAQRAIIDIGTTIGITFGTTWGNEIDLREK